MQELVHYVLEQQLLVHIFNVRINAKDIKDRVFAEEILFKAKEIYDKTNVLEKEMIELIDTKI